MSETSCLKEHIGEIQNIRNAAGNHSARNKEGQVDYFQPDAKGDGQ